MNSHVMFKKFKENSSKTGMLRFLICNLRTDVDSIEIGANTDMLSLLLYFGKGTLSYTLTA